MWTYKAQLRRVIDGDTIDVAIDLGFGVYMHERLRLAGIDTPELRLEEKEAGEAAKLALIGKLAEHEGQLIVTTDKDRGKYGRWIATVSVGEGSSVTNINRWLVEQGHAVEVNYD